MVWLTTANDGIHQTPEIKNKRILEKYSICKLWKPWQLRSHQFLSNAIHDRPLTAEIALPPPLLGQNFFMFKQFFGKHSMLAPPTPPREILDPLLVDTTHWKYAFYIVDLLLHSSNKMKLCWCEYCCSLLLIGGITLSHNHWSTTKCHDSFCGS